MYRNFAIALLVSCFAAAGWAQSPSTSASPAAPQAAKSTAKKPTPKAAASKTKSDGRAAPAASGPCSLGVISAIGDRFAVHKFGVTVFETEDNEVPIDNWGLDDVVLARVRALTGTDPSIRKISYPRGAFEPYYNPKSRLLRDPGEDLPAIVRGITANANCERYLVVTRFKAQLPGTSLTVNGIGAYNRGLGSLVRHSHLFANISISLLDGRTYEKIDRRVALLKATFADGMRLMEDPMTRLDNSLFPDPPATASGSAALREKTRALVAAKLDLSLPAVLRDE